MWLDRRLTAAKATMRKSERPAVSPLRGEGHQVQFSICHPSGNLDSEKCPGCAQGVRDGSDRQQRQLRTGKHPIRSPHNQFRQSQTDCSLRMGSRILAVLPECSHSDAVGGENTGGDHRICASSRPEKRKGWRILSAQLDFMTYEMPESHHRFTVSGHLVHNCGYGGGVGALKAMNAKMPEEEMQPLVDAWRAANPHIVAFWGALDRAAREVIEEHTSARVGKVSLFWKDDRMFIQLPQGGGSATSHRALWRTALAAGASVTSRPPPTANWRFRRPSGESWPKTLLRPLPAICWRTA